MNSDPIGNCVPQISAHIHVREKPVGTPCRFHGIGLDVGNQPPNLRKSWGPCLWQRLRLASAPSDCVGGKKWIMSGSGRILEVGDTLLLEIDLIRKGSITFISARKPPRINRFSLTASLGNCESSSRTVNTHAFRCYRHIWGPRSCAWKPETEYFFQYSLWSIKCRISHFYLLGVQIVLWLAEWHADTPYRHRDRRARS